MLPKIKALTVCVGYDDILALTLDRMLQELDELTIVTHPHDLDTMRLCNGRGSKVGLYTTDAFYREGAKFNKGLAIEECFDYMGRSGWMLILDADILLPEGLRSLLPPLEVSNLYCPWRRILSNPKDLPKLKNWKQVPRRNDMGLYGYFQLFNAAAPALDVRPWYGVEYGHAGFGDKDFQNRWEPRNKVRMPFDVLHLGEPDKNWFGRSTERLDGKVVDGASERRQLQETLRAKHGWRDRKPPITINEKVYRGDG